MATNGTNQTEGLSKDEVGWYFVEQYYTTLSKNPNRLHLFYGKKSQLVYGTETEVADISVGRQNIQERIAKLDFQDCKVRVSNVDSQASLENILIQVIGEISNKSEDSRKFVQTFILAEQQSGYFVLNDIFRYIKEEEAESTDAAAATPAKEEKAAAAEEVKPEETQAPAAKAKEVEAAKPQLDAAVVNKKLEEVSAEKATAVPAVATPAETAPAKAVVPAVPAVPAVATPAPAPDAEKVVQEVAEEEEEKTEAPKEPAPTPAVAPAATPAAAPAAAPVAAPAPVAAAAAAEPEKPKGPPKPMTWASRAAAAAGPTRPVALPKPATAAAPASPATSAATSATAAPAKPAAAAAPAGVAAAKAADAEAGKDSGSEWQTAGADSKRQNRPQSISGPPQDKDSALGYVKYVTDKVDEAALRSHLETFGPVVYFDISRTKNCAFIEFASPAGYQAAVAANPHTINGESILVEARRPKAGAYGGSNYNPNRGNLSSRGRGGFEGRNGSQGGGRGGFTGQNRGRGGASASRGRGGAQLAA